MPESSDPEMVNSTAAVLPAGRLISVADNETDIICVSGGSVSGSVTAGVPGASD